MKRCSSRSRGGLPSLILCFVLVATCGGSRAQVAAEAPAIPAPLDLTRNPDAQADRLYAQIWMESSPEYHALCLQAFNAALLAVRDQVARAPEMQGRPVGATGKPLAVVADLDETVLDNSGYQRQLVLAGKEFSPASWNRWVQQISGVALVPGAARFISAVESLGVTVVYVSNRPDQFRQSTIRTLELLGLNVQGLDDPDRPRLQLRTDSSDKGPRRQRTLQHFEVIAFLGDNIEDFPALLGERPADLRAEVDRYLELWGTRWFVLPNPVYGSWTRPFRGQPPRDYLEGLQ